jgi:hypothetical protein
MTGKSTSNEANASGLETQIRSLRRDVWELQGQSLKKRKLYTTLGAVLGVVAVIYLSFVTSKIFQLDARALTELGRQEVERQLPERLADLRRHLKAEAPALVENMLDEMLGYVPEIRSTLVESLDKQNTQIAKKLEAELDPLVEETLKNGRAQLDELGAGHTDVEKIDILTQFVAADLRKNVSASLDGLYPEFASELNRVKSFLVDIQHKDESELTERERVQKEIVQTLLQIIAREGVQ